MADDADDVPEQLRALGRGLPVRLPDGLADRVLTEVAVTPARRTTRRRRWAAGVVALVAATGVSVAAAAPVRAALGYVLGFGGVQVREGSGPAPAPTPGLPGERRTDVETAQREVAFRIRVPAVLGEPDFVTVADGRVVSLHYAQPGGEVRIDEFEGGLGDMWAKYAEGAAQLTTVGGLEALWFSDSVTLVYIDADGIERKESSRLTNGSLVWMDEGVTFRIDGLRPLESAVTVALSMR
jgi:hypothetical protein